MIRKILKFIPSILLIGVIIFFVNKNINSSISIKYPFDHTIFPPEFPAPTFSWNAKKTYIGNWEIKVKTTSDFKYTVILNKNEWKPSDSLWDSILQASNYEDIIFSVKRCNNIGTQTIRFKISHDSVGAPILYRQMPIPFVLAEKTLDSMNFMLINIGQKGSPHIAMKGFSVCGNCHSFTQDGKQIGLDLDAGLRDKGGYFIAQINDSIVFDVNNYMSWTKIEQRRTFGMFSKLSPDGRYIVTTVKDRVISENFPYDPDHIPFSQLFFPVNGHLAVYDRQTKVLKELSGANLDEYVQSNATWTPDGKNIVFCRASALPRKNNLTEINITDPIVIDSFVERKKLFKYDICIIPFNNGNGGAATVIEGASRNGKSNYFPAVSPDGKWLAFCQAESFMLLQPDSKLFIVPIKGGNAKQLACNLNLMNSWHAWSPNSKWLTFVSKGLSIYTDLYLTHIDADGNASPAVLVEKARSFTKVVNYPEFINIKADKTFKMVYKYVEITHIIRALDAGKVDLAKDLYFQLKQQNNISLKEDYEILLELTKKLGLKDESKRLENIIKRL